jgi:3-hydroxybutyryl-CoA dehydrogenase
MQIKNVCVIGSGTMGAGIAQVFAVSGYNVLMNDVKQEFVDRGYAAIEKSLAKFVEKGKMQQADMQAALSRIKKSTKLEDASNVELAVEAVFEDMSVKRDVFRKLDEAAPKHAILASNTSSISLTGIAACTRRPDKVIGMHFMNPVPLMKLVEIIRAIATSDETYRIIEETTRKLGKEPVEVNDYPGFVSNRILIPMINEACYCLMEGVATRESIDKVMELGMNHPMGPLKLADLIGLDVALNIMNVLHEGLGDSKYRPCPLLRKMVAAGYLGKKSGKGFYEYNK